jgi:hypothetical protein
MPDLGRFKNNKLTLILAATVASIFLLILIKAWLADDGDALENLYETVGITKTEKNNTPVVVVPEYKRLSVEEAKLRIKIAKSKTRMSLANIHVHRIEQERLLKNFQNTIHLKMNFPAHLDYTQVDLEDDVGAIIGTTTNLDQTFAVLASSREVTVDQVLQYLKEESGVFSVVKGHEFQADKAFKFEPPESSGLAELTVIPTSSKGNRGLYAVFAPRADKKGNYLFMMEAKKSYFEENEDGFEKLLEGMKTQP